MESGSKCTHRAAPTPAVRASQHGGGLRPCFGQLGAGDELDLRALLFGGGRSLSTKIVGHVPALQEVAGNHPTVYTSRKLGSRRSKASASLSPASTLCTSILISTPDGGRLLGTCPLHTLSHASLFFSHFFSFLHHRKPPPFPPRWDCRWSLHGRLLGPIP